MSIVTNRLLTARRSLRHRRLHQFGSAGAKTQATAVPKTCNFKKQTCIGRSLISSHSSKLCRYHHGFASTMSVIPQMRKSSDFTHFRGVIVFKQSSCFFSTSPDPSTSQSTSSRSASQTSCPSISDSKNPSKTIESPPKPILVRISIGVKSVTFGIFKFFTSYRYAKEKTIQLWRVIVREVKHLWKGMKLLAADVRTLFRLLRRVTKGHSLTRREKRQAQRTLADLFRLVPFLTFVLIPFMEFLLPVAIKIFPNMLPSQFQTQHQKAENRKRQLQLRLNMAAFLQNTVETLADEVSTKKPGDLKESHGELAAMLTRVRQGYIVDNASILKVAALFEDDITIDNASRRTLVSMCKYMGLRPYGTDAWLRMNLLNHLNSIRRDDRAIRKEGIDLMSLSEVQTACRERGMRATGLEEYQYRTNLQQWLDLSLNENVPPSLLILSRSFTVYQKPHEIKAPDPTTQIKSAIKDIGEDAVSEVIVEKIRVADLEKEREIVKRKDALIVEEREEKERKEDEIRAAKKAAEKETEIVKETEIADDGEDDKKKEKIITEDEARVKLRGITEALVAMASDSPVEQEREKLEELIRDAEVSKKKREQEELHIEPEQLDNTPILEIEPEQPDTAPELIVEPEQPDIAPELKIVVDEVIKTEEEIDQDLKAHKDKQEPKIHKLQTKVEEMLTNIAKDIDKAEGAIGETLKILDADRDGVMTYDEIHEAIKRELKIDLTEEQTAQFIRLLDRKGDQIIDFQELEESIEDEKESEDKEEDNNKSQNGNGK